MSTTLLLLLAPLTVGFLDTVEGSGVEATQTRNLEAFQEIDVSGSFNIEVIPSNEYKVELSGDDNLLEMVVTDVKGDRLIIKSKDSWRPKSKMMAKIYTSRLTKADLSGAVKANLQIPGQPKRFEVDGSGATKVTLSGQTGKLVLDLSGASKIDALELKAKDVSIDASGAAKVKVYADGELKVDASGAAKIRYAGQPTSIEQDTSGAVSIKRLQ